MLERRSSSSPDSVGASQGQEHKARGEGDRLTIVYGYLVFYLTERGEKEFILSRLSWCLSGASQGQGHKVRGEGDRLTIVYGYLVFNLNDWEEREPSVSCPEQRECGPTP